MDQWLRPCGSNAWDSGSIPGQGTKIPHATQHGQKNFFNLFLIFKNRKFSDYF